jgi:apolipoprotein N-acyltransferase
VLRQLPQHAIGRIDGRVPAALPPTPFARLGNVLPLLWAMVFLALAALAVRHRRG